MPVFPKLKMRWTIRRKIATAFTAIGAITTALGVLCMTSTNKAGELVARTYDETVVTTVYARAASSDFSSMRAELANALMSPPSQKGMALATLQALHDSFQQDLATAAERSRSPEIRKTVEMLHDAEDEWLQMSRGIDQKFTLDAWKRIEEKSHVVEKGIETMVSKVADDGFANRVSSIGATTSGEWIALVATILAIAISAVVSFVLSRRISVPLRTVARFADEIARGKLDGEAPPQSSDEIGDLTGAMVSMRRDISAMMQEKDILQQQSQARVAEALDGSSEGVIIVAADGTVQLINAKALYFLNITESEAPNGAKITQLINTMSTKKDDRSALLRMKSKDAEVEEVFLRNGCWIQSSRNRTSEGGMVALYTDITTIRAQKDALAAANLNLDGAMANMSQGLCVFDAENRLQLANPLFHMLLGLSPDDIAPGTEHTDLMALVAARAGYDGATTQRAIRHEMTVVRRRRRTNRLVVLGDRIIAVTHVPMPEGGWLGTLEDVTDRRRAESRIAFLATHDSLTKLPNRILLARRVDEALARAKRGTGFAILCLDLDRFKQVNDTLGHAVGDELLQAVTERLRSCVRDSDTVARLGGDEFAVLLANAPDEAECSNLAKRIIDSLCAPYAIQGQDVTTGVSIGIARAPTNGMDHGKLLKGADAALYKSKEEGRGRWHFFADEMDERLQERRALEHDLRKAVVNGEFEVYYQPLLDVKAMEIGSFEALVRWNHPSRGLVAPNEFIPVAEETGIISEIGRWVMETACKQAAAWSSKLRIAVNVSAVQLRDKDFNDMVQDALLASGLAAAQLEIEITESAFMTNNAKAGPVLMSLKELGVNFAMDDFGTGHSSLSNLRSFPFGKIKIDRSFVRDLGHKKGAEQIIKTIIILGKTLDMRVTAEGVETRRQLQFLEEEGCDDIQGYLVGRPMQSHHVPELLAQYNQSESRAA